MIRGMIRKLIGTEPKALPAPTPRTHHGPMGASSAHSWQSPVSNGSDNENPEES